MEKETQLPQKGFDTSTPHFQGVLSTFFMFLT